VWFLNIHTFENHTHESTMDLTLAKTIEGFMLKNAIRHDHIHGDRVEAFVEQ
jgi:UDP-N-acetylglucosamine 2-epimerase (hydrolysing)